MGYVRSMYDPETGITTTHHTHYGLKYVTLRHGRKRISARETPEAGYWQVHHTERSAFTWAGSKTLPGVYDVAAIKAMMIDWVNGDPPKY